MTHPPTVCNDSSRQRRLPRHYGYNLPGFLASILQAECCMQRWYGRYFIAMSDLLAALRAQLGDRYRIERELGGGGMSRVFVAEEVALGRRIHRRVRRPPASGP